MKLRRIRPLDSGGQGFVYEVEDIETGERLALKDLKALPDDVDPESTVKRFTREARCQSQLKHPGIVRVLGLNLSADPPFYVMPLADESLRDRMRASPNGLGDELALSIFERLLDAVGFAHREGVTHRDLKPENVLFFADVPALSDFGLSRQLGSGSSTITKPRVGLGTVQYAAPEQLTDGHAADARSDVFSLGKILYEMLTGQMPWPRIKSNLVPAKFRWIIDHATSEEPDRRYASVEELRNDLTILTSGASSLSSPKDLASASIQEIFVGNVADGARQLLNILSVHSDDQVFYFDFVVHLPAEVLAMCELTDRESYLSALRAFCGHCEGRHVFSFTDTLAEFLDRAFRSTNDQGIRGLVLETILDLGARHNRFHVREISVRLMEESCKSQYGTMQLAQILKSASIETVRFLEPAANQYSWPTIIKQELHR